MVHSLFADQTLIGSLNGGDERIEALALQGPISSRVSSVVTIVTHAQENTQADGSYTFNWDYTRNAKSYAPLCSGEKFSDQRLYREAKCGGTLIAPNLVLTAKHCFTEDDSVSCGNKAIVLGYHAGVRSFPKDNVYNCSEIIFSKYSQGIDVALIKLDRPVKDANVTPLRLNPSRRIREGASITAVGPQFSLPLKASPGVIRYKNNEGHYGLGADADCGPGNSGGPVFNAQGDLIGIVAAGAPPGKVEGPNQETPHSASIKKKAPENTEATPLGETDISSLGKSSAANTTEERGCKRWEFASVESSRENFLPRSSLTSGVGTIAGGCMIVPVDYFYSDIIGFVRGETSPTPQVEAYKRGSENHSAESLK